jgi:hypothetical protein
MITVYPLPVKEKSKVTDLLLMSLELFNYLLKGVETRHDLLKIQLEEILTRKLQGTARKEDQVSAAYLSKEINLSAARIVYLREAIAQTEEKIARRDACNTGRFDGSGRLRLVLSP